MCYNDTVKKTRIILCTFGRERYASVGLPPVRGMGSNMKKGGFREQHKSPKGEVVKYQCTG